MRALVLVLAVGALAIPAAAIGKGPAAATMEGPGGPITFGGSEASGPLGDLTERSGWFPEAFAQSPDPLLPARPEGELGPRYVVVYAVPGPDNDTFTIRQHVYPYATSGPVTYMAPGQPVFDTKTTGGWFQAGTDLKETLVTAGLPESAPKASRGDASFPAVTVWAFVIVLLACAAGLLLVRRRARPSPA
jgi:hypothetical protein